MGHAGAWAAPGEPSAKVKYEALEKAGVTMVSHPEKFGNGMKTLLKNRGFQSTTSVCDECLISKGKPADFA
jgi:succinyl-CoA synthetase alpha subunit